MIRDPGAGFLPVRPGGAEPINDDSFDEDIARPGNVYVEFWTARCAGCRRLAPWLEELVREEGGTVCTVDIELEPECARRAAITVAPTVVLYRGGVEVGRLEGGIGHADLVDFVRSAPRRPGV
ncbi:MAG: thioredoxin family protein [Armatimonadota bacterium]